MLKRIRRFSRVSRISRVSREERRRLAEREGQQSGEERVSRERGSAERRGEGSLEIGWVVVNSSGYN